MKTKAVPKKKRKLGRIQVRVDKDVLDSLNKHQVNIPETVRQALAKAAGSVS